MLDKIETTQPRALIILKVLKESGDIFIELLASDGGGLGSALVSGLKTLCIGQQLEADALKDAFVFWRRMGFEVIDPAHRTGFKNLTFWARMERGEEAYKKALAKHQHQAAALAQNPNRRSSSRIQTPPSKPVWKLSPDEWMQALGKFGSDHDSVMMAFDIPVAKAKNKKPRNSRRK